MNTLLAIDLGVRTGWASYNDSGFLSGFGSHNYGSAGRLKKAVYPFLKQFKNLEFLIIEGGGKLSKYWEYVATQNSIEVIQTHAHVWRKELFLQKNITYSYKMKKHAERTAREIIEKSNLSQPKDLKHDAAEAILIGFWGCLQIGWLANK